MAYKKNFLTITAVFLTLAAPCWAGGSKDEGAVTTKTETVKQETPQIQTQQEPSNPWTGEGGEGISLAVLEPAGKELSPNEQWMLSLIQSSITGDFGKYSAMTIIDRLNLEKILAEQMELMPGDYSESDYIKIGQLVNAKYILDGSVSKTDNAFTLELAVTDAESGERKASLTQVSVTQASLESLSAVKEASADLLMQLGVVLTYRGLADLKKPLAIPQVNAETALARGIIAQRQGKEAASLSCFFQAASLNPSLTEAARRSSTMSADITSGNIGADIRDDIMWRRGWVARLTETENFINNLPPPYTLFYTTAIETDAVDYQTETVELKIQTNMQASGIPFVQKAVQVVYDGLNATKRKTEWGLANWPMRGVTNANPFASQKQYNIQVVFELVNERDQVIGRQTSSLRPGFSFSLSNNKVGVNYAENTFSTVTFNAVNENDLSGSLTVRIASVTGTPPQNAQFQTVAFPGSAEQWNNYRFYPLLDISNGVIRGFKSSLSDSEIAQYPNLIILPDAWGVPLGITSVRNLAFYEKRLTSVAIPNGAASIGDFAFAKNQLTGVTLPNSVTTIGKYTFSGNRLTDVTIPNSVTSIGEGAFSKNRLTGVTIPNSVKSIGDDAFNGNALTSVTVPNSVISIGKYAFSKNQLSGVTIPNSVTSIGEGAFSGNSLTSITISNSVTSIEKDMFSYNRLTGVTIPNSVTSIGASAFRFNQITRITIGANVRLGSVYDSFDYGFDNFYNKNGKKAGTYTRPDAYSDTWVRK